MNIKLSRFLHFPHLNYCPPFNTLFFSISSGVIDPLLVINYGLVKTAYSSGNFYIKNIRVLHVLNDFTSHYSHLFAMIQNTSLTWWTSRPELTPCFMTTALPWLPSAWFWVCLPFYIYYLASHKGPQTPCGKLHIAKLVRIWSPFINKTMGLL